MSRTLFIEYGNDGFWAYDVAVGVLLKHVIERVGQHLELTPSAWLSECVERWRVNAVISDLGLHLDPEWTADQRQLVCTFIDDACKALANVDVITAEEAESWRILDGEGVDTRDATHIATTPVVELGRAIIALLEGTLPSAPSGYWWFIGTEAGRTTIRMLA